MQILSILESEETSGVGKNSPRNFRGNFHWKMGRRQDSLWPRERSSLSITSPRLPNVFDSQNSSMISDPMGRADSRQLQNKERSSMDNDSFSSFGVKCHGITFVIVHTPHHGRTLVSENGRQHARKVCHVQTKNIKTTMTQVSLYWVIQYRAVFSEKYWKYWKQ